MQRSIHPNYGDVIYRDMITGDEMATRSTLGREGEPPRVINVEVSRFSSPAYGNATNFIPERGAVAKFRARYGAR